MPAIRQFFRISILSLSVLLAGASLTQAQGSGAKTTVTGFLRDGYCYIVSGAQGPSHKYCATQCAEKGIPVLLVESAPTTSYQLDPSGKGYMMKPRKGHRTFVLLPPTDLESLPQDVIDKMEEEVTIAGEILEKDGMNFLRVDSVQ